MLCDHLDGGTGWGWEGDSIGRGPVHSWLIHVVVWQKPTQHCKAIILQLKFEREVGGGIGMGNTCKSMANSCQCMTKTTTIL